MVRSRGAGWRRRADRFQHPAKAIVGGFAGAVAVGAGLLSLPMATESGRRAPLVDALFTATSAVCVTGLTTVDTGTYWSAFGEAVILVLIQVGGLGIMTLATLLTLLVSRRLGLGARFLAQAETKSLDLNNVRRVIARIVTFSLVSEAIAAVILAVRFAVGYHERPGSAIYHGVFHAVSAFNNAGFSTNGDNLSRYVTDPWICLTVAFAVILGGIGFPVVFELAKRWRTPARWSVMTRLSLGITAILLTAGTVTFTVAERANPKTLGGLSAPAKLLAGFFASSVARTAGFNTVDIGALKPESLLCTDVLMFIGGGSGGTAGGVKITTFGVLAFVIWAEMRGLSNVNIGNRRIPASNQRQALAIALLGVGTVTMSTFALLSMSGFSLDAVLFEAISAFGTVGLSTGITPKLTSGAQLLLAALMFVGRTGPLTLASALALRERAPRYELPEERTIVG